MHSKRVEELLGEFEKCRVAVLGDLMIDRYIWGKASRISQEAPVPVVCVDKATATPGGAANVLRNLSSLGAEALAFGVVGDDDSSRELAALLDDCAVAQSGVVREAARRTTEKTRIIAGNQQIVRVDTEDVTPPGESQTENLLSLLKKEIETGKLSAIIVQDYAKGMITREILQQVVELASKSNVPVALDPNSGHPFNVRGLTLLAPNRTEAFSLAGIYHSENRATFEEDRALHEVASKLQDLWSPQQLLITLGAAGLALFTEGNPAHHVPTQAREVFDVSGAGDTVIAAYVLALGSGASSEESCVIANHAAGVVVGKVGAAPIFPDELLQRFTPQSS